MSLNYEIVTKGEKILVVWRTINLTATSFPKSILVFKFDN